MHRTTVSNAIERTAFLPPATGITDASNKTQSTCCYAHCRSRADRLTCMARYDEAGSGLAAKRRLDQVLQDPRALGDQRPSSSKQVHVTASQQTGLVFVHRTCEGLTTRWPPGTAPSSLRPALSNPRLLGSLRASRHMSVTFHIVAMGSMRAMQPALCAPTPASPGLARRNGSRQPWSI